MVVLSSGPARVDQSISTGIRTVDLTNQPWRLPSLILKSFEEHGFFKLINHGIQRKTVATLQKECIDFFSRSPGWKNQAAAGPANPSGYGCRNIGPNGDVGELEYLLLHSDPLWVNERSKAISDEPTKFSDAVNQYTHAVRELASQILDLLCEGLQLSDRHAFSKLIRDVASDSLLRINQYPPTTSHVAPRHSTIGFGEHSDPQIISLLRSNDVEGLQIELYNGLWVTVPPDPDAFYVIVGDALQVMTNGRVTSVRHRAILADSTKTRMSMVFFGAPPLRAWIVPRPEMVSLNRPNMYKAFTWGDFKKVMYTLRLGDCRLDLFKVNK